MLRIGNSKIAAVAAGAMLIAGIGIAAQEGKQSKKSAAAAAKQVMVNPDDVKWGPAPAALPPGLQMAVLDGNPEKAGRFAIRVKMPDGFTVPPHSHPTDEQLTVISGTFMLGMGSKVDERSMHSLRAGGYARMPASTNHYVRSKGETVLQISAAGPFAIKYANPSDDPRKKTTARK